MNFARISILVLFALEALAQAPDKCASKVWYWKVDKQAALSLQESVNQGFQPWRMDDVITIAEQAIEERKKEWSDWNTVTVLPMVVSESRDTAQLNAISQPSGTIRYHVTLKKYGWLLNSARQWKSVIWLPEKVERLECEPSTR